MNANDDLTTLNGVLLKGELNHRVKIFNGVWHCVYNGIMDIECFTEIFRSNPKTLSAVNGFFVGEFDYSFKLISDMDNFVRYSLILREVQL